MLGVLEGEKVVGGADMPGRGNAPPLLIGGPDRGGCCCIIGRGGCCIIGRGGCCVIIPRRGGCCCALGRLERICPVNPPRPAWGGVASPFETGGRPADIPGRGCCCCVPKFAFGGPPNLPAPGGDDIGAPRGAYPPTGGRGGCCPIPPEEWGELPYPPIVGLGRGWPPGGDNIGFPRGKPPGRGGCCPTPPNERGG